MVESGWGTPLLKVGLRLNTFGREECLGRKGHWLSLQVFRYFIIMEVSLEPTWLQITSSFCGGAWGLALTWVMATNLWRTVVSWQAWFPESQVKHLPSLSGSPGFQSSSTGNQGAFPVPTFSQYSSLCTPRFLLELCLWSIVRASDFPCILLTVSNKGYGDSNGWQIITQSIWSGPRKCMKWE